MYHLPLDLLAEFLGSTYLVYAGEVLDIRSQDGETIVLPCKVTKPDVAAFLYKETSKVRFKNLIWSSGNDSSYIFLCL